MKKYDVAIIGGGFQGLFLAYKLSKKYKIVLIEKEKYLGGLLSGVKINKSYVEKYYHHLFPQDFEIKNLLKELNLQNKFVWKTTTSGFYYKGKIYPFTNPLHLLNFKPLTLKEKIELVFLLLKIKLADTKKLDNILAKKWIIKNSSLGLYKKMFEPLIISKFGKENLNKISAAWFVSRIKLRSRSTGKGETLGYLKGGFQQLINALEREIKNNGSEILRAKFSKFKIKNNKIESAICGKRAIKASTYISTIPPEITFKGITLPQDYNKKLKQIEYQGAICLLLGLRKKISNLYWINVIGAKNFGAIIEHTNFQPIKNYNSNIIYLASYYSINSKIWKEKDKEITENFIKELKKFFPKIKNYDIIYKKLFKDKYAGIISKKGFFKNLLPFKTPIKNLFVVGMFNTYPERGLELQARLARKLIEKIKNEIQK